MPYDHYKTIPSLVILMHDMYDALADKPEKEMLEGNMPVSFFLNKALGCFPSGSSSPSKRTRATEP
jgi:hypothetical protein